jgi:hypothetical protein
MPCHVAEGFITNVKRIDLTNSLLPPVSQNPSALSRKTIPLEN